MTGGVDAMLRTLIALSVAVCVLAGALAAGWAFAGEVRPATAYRSHNGEWTLHVDVATGLALTRDTGQTTRTVWIRDFPQRVEGVPCAPRHAYVTDDGSRVVLCGVCGPPGVGDVLVVLGAAGEVIAGYALRDLFTEAELAELPRTPQGCSWFEESEFIFLAGQMQFCAVTQTNSGATLRVLDLTEGRRLELLASADDGSTRSAVAGARSVAPSMARPLRQTATERTISTMYILLVGTGALALSLLMYALDKKYA
jgi:hypothetical protein